MTTIRGALAPGRLAAHIDAEGKLPRALETIGQLAGGDVVLVDADRGGLARALAGLGARVTALAPQDRVAGLSAALSVGPAPAVPIEVAEGDPCALGRPDASADAVLGGWSVYRGVDPDELAEAERVLRVGGRHLIVHDYGRDEVSGLVEEPRPEYDSWGRRGGPFLRAGFRIRVVHCWWTFDSLESAAEVLRAGYGARGDRVAVGLRRPRLSYNVAIYHRLREA